MMNFMSHTRPYRPTVIFLGLLSIIAVTGSNQALFLWLNHVAQWAPDALWSNLTFLCDATVGFAVMTLLIKRHANLVFWGIWGGVVSAVAINLMKHGFAVARPPGVLALDSFNNIGAALKMGSFPSGHTTTAFFVAALIANTRQSNGWTAVCLAGALLLGFSRIAVGVHWPADVMAGAAFGWALGIATATIALKSPPIGQYRRIFTIVICLIGSLYLFLFDPKLPNVQPLQWSIASLCTVLALHLLFTELRTLWRKTL